MKNLLKIMLASLLALSMLICMFACDTANSDDTEGSNKPSESGDAVDNDTDGTTDDTNDNNEDDTNAGALTPEQMLDGKWEDSAFIAAGADGVAVTSISNVVTYQEGECIAKSEMKSTFKFIGDNMFTDTFMDMTYMFPEYGTEHIFMYQSTTTLKQGDSYKTYIYGASEGEEVYLLISITADEAEEAIKLLHSSSDESEGDDADAFSILDFNSVSTSVKDDGSFEFSCTGIKAEIADKYTQLFAGTVDGSINSDTLKYTVVVKDEKIVSMDIEVEVNSETGEGYKQLSRAVISTQYDYSKVEIKIPENWDNDNDIELSWNDYVGSLG